MFIKAFAVGGLICAIAQFIINFTDLTAGKILVIFIFMLADALATGAEVFDAAIRDWVAGLDEAAMRVFIETVFFVLGADDGVLVSDYIRSPRKTFAGFRPGLYDRNPRS